MMKSGSFYTLLVSQILARNSDENADGAMLEAAGSYKRSSLQRKWSGGCTPCAKRHNAPALFQHSTVKSQEGMSGPEQAIIVVEYLASCPSLEEGSTSAATARTKWLVQDLTRTFTALDMVLRYELFMMPSAFRRDGGMASRFDAKGRLWERMTK